MRRYELRAFRVVFLNGHEPLLAGIQQRSYEERVRHSEYKLGGAYTEGQYTRRGASEKRLFAENRLE